VKTAIWTISLLLALAPLTSAATAGEERPPREMLRIMDLLLDWDLIKDHEVVRQIEAMNRAENPPAESNSPNDPRAKTKEGKK
jgi:hypothetical protein